MSLTPDNLSDLNLAPPSWDWQPHQRVIAEQIAASTKKIIILEAEPGTGKSLIPIAAAKSIGKSAIVLTQTRQLEDQYMRDFPSLVKMEGRRWFTCNVTGGKADQAPCTVGVRCDKAGQWNRETKMPIGNPECNYFRHKAKARRAQISIHNYAYWLGEVQSAGIFSQPDWIVCDEAHELDRLLMENGAVEVAYTNMHKFKVTPSNTINSLDDLCDWADYAEPIITESIRQLAGRAADLGMPVDSIDGLRPVIDLDHVVRNEQVMEVITEYRAAIQLQDAIIHIRSRRDDDKYVIDRDDRSVSIKPIFGAASFRQLVNTARDKVINTWPLVKTGTHQLHRKTSDGQFKPYSHVYPIT